jgi:hypothetical protein
MERYRLTPGKAYAVLRQLSRDLDTKVAVLAEELVSTGHSPKYQPPPPGVDRSESSRTCAAQWWQGRRSIRCVGCVIGVLRC